MNTKRSDSPAVVFVRLQLCIGALCLKHCYGDCTQMETLHACGLQLFIKKNNHLFSPVVMLLHNCQ